MFSTSPSLAADVAFVAEESYQVRVNAMQKSPKPEKGAVWVYYSCLFHMAAVHNISHLLGHRWLFCSRPRDRNR